MLEPWIEARIEAIRRNRTSGAAELAAEAAGVLAAVPRAALAETVRALIDAQPVMAPLFNLGNAVLRSPDAGAAAREFIARMRSSAAAVAAQAAALIPEDAAVLTHSYSSAVLAALLAAKRAGKTFSAICTESRPMREGLALAGKLGGEGIAVTVIADCAVYQFLKLAQLALVGADAVSPRAVINKTGTAQLALAAKALGVPLYSLCGPEKLVPEDWEFRQTPQDPREILESPPPCVTAANHYFEATPREYFTGIITAPQS